MRLPILKRRTLLALLPAAALATRLSPATAQSEPIGTATDVKGEVTVQRAGRTEPIVTGADIFIGDVVSTRSESLAGLNLADKTQVWLGSQAEIAIDQFVADQGGVLELHNGPMVFDRPPGLPPINVSLKTSFGMIGVRGTKFFAGPSKDVFGVFVAHGSVSVTNAGVERLIEAGLGVNIAAPDQPPSEPAAWGEARIEAAYASVGL